MVSFAGAARAYAERKDTALLAQTLADIRSQAQRAADIVARIRGFVKQQTPGFQPCTLDAIVANVLGLPDFDFDSSLDVLRLAPALSKPGVTHIPVDLMSNATQAAMDTTPVPHVPVVAGIYALDGLVRRASSLQMTAAARSATAAQEVAA